MGNNCENCIHYEEAEDGCGFCRRYPPNKDMGKYVSIGRREYYVMSHPVVSAKETFCGEWEQR